MAAAFSPLLTWPLPRPQSLSSDVRYSAGYYLSGAHFLVPTLSHGSRSASDGGGRVGALILMICLAGAME